MIIEVILLIIIILYIYTIFWRPHQTESVSTQTGTTDESSIASATSEAKIQKSSLPPPADASASSTLCKLPISTATTAPERQTVEIKITGPPEKIDVKPTWFDPIPPSKSIPTRLPPNYDVTSETDRRKVNCVTSYRSMTNKKSLDFVKDPFPGAIDDTETLIAVLDQVVNQFGIELGFSKSQFVYDDSDWRIPLDNRHLGNVHSIIAFGNDTNTATFKFNLDLKYRDVTQNDSILKEFVLRFIRAIASFIKCDLQLIRVFGIEDATSKNNNISVKFGIITRSETETNALAQQLQNKVSTKSILERETDDILQHIIPMRYEYTLESALVHLQLQKSDFEPNYNRDYDQDHPLEDRRGGRPYYLPISWFRHALKVKDKYPKDKLWLGHKNVPGEWSVAYHGTCDFSVKGIVQGGFSHSKGETDFYKQEAMQKVGSKANVKGIYLATHCEGGATIYAKPFSVKNNDGKVIKYKMVFQCRVEPGKYTEHIGRGVNVGKILRVFDEKAIRPYGILLKEEKEPALCVSS